MRSDLYYFNPRPPWGGRHRLLFLAGSFLISIHALRGEGDWSKPKSNQIRSNFNPRPPWGGRLLLPALRRENGKISIHALRGEGDAQRAAGVTKEFEFQSTPSVGRATSVASGIPAATAFQSTPSVGRATLASVGAAELTVEFQSTPSVGRATRQFRLLVAEPENISIHALRGEGDNIETETALLADHFNPRPPWGGRRLCQIKKRRKAQFQSTPSVGRATIGAKTGRDALNYFNPRPPWGGRL